MNDFPDIKSLLPEGFDAQSRVWIYQSNRRFGLGEVLSLEPVLEAFTHQWKSHGVPVKGYANLFYGQFIILMADERASGVSGCSTDSSVRMIKQIETDYKVQLFDRTLLAFLVSDKIQMLPLSQLLYAVSNGFIKSDTPYFNTLAATRKALEESFIIPAGDSWMGKKYFGASV